MNILKQTDDGSFTLFSETIGEHYHSSHGALQESKHVFIEAGLKKAISLNGSPLSVLEVGFGTGLNFLLSFAHCEDNQIKLDYTGIEAFPLDVELIKQTAYDQYVSEPVWQEFIKSYPLALSKREILTAHVSLEIAHTTLLDFQSKNAFDVLYYDAFSVRHQPEMWTDEVIAHACSFLKPGGVFITYAITGNLKRAVKKCGFTIEKLPGAPGKREMLRAIKMS
jgi:tRNA U34 5-methylaminomethyl-2-thiouridine-forming methyltransferase MnmC